MVGRHSFNYYCKYLPAQQIAEESLWTWPNRQRREFQLIVGSFFVLYFMISFDLYWSSNDFWTSTEIIIYAIRAPMWMQS